MPHAEQTFYKMKCGWAEDPKVAALARFGPVDACLARDLFGQLIDYARRELTDGLVPADAIGLVAYPLPAADAMRVAMQLADPGPFGPLCAWDAPRNGASNAPGNAPGNALRVLNYPKWNDTRAEVEARREQGTKAARTRWDRADQGRDTASNAARNAPPIQRESKSKNPPSPPADGQWSPTDALRPPPAPTRGGGPRSGPRTTHPNAAAAIAASTRPGGPSEHVAEHAAEARRRLLGRAEPAAAPEPDPLPLDLAPAPAEVDEYPF
jgi:hypothetical protein